MLYKATFRVESDVAASARETVPQFRLRLNDGSLHSASIVVVDSRGAASQSPVAGEPGDYVVYFRFPPGLAPDAGLLAALDYLNFDAEDNATATLKLREVMIEAVPYPW